MNENFTFIDGSITSPKGFYAAGVACGLKKNGKLDLALISSKTLANSCGVFTKNVVKGHSLQRTMKTIKNNNTKAVVINSGNANACVGEQGVTDADDMANFAANLLECNPDEIVTGSTGVIGQLLNMDKLKSGISNAFNQLDSSIESGHNAEYAIMTTDLVPKEFTLQFNIKDKLVTISGMAKGSGMIHPNMATMIAVITTDCSISKSLLQQALSFVTNKTFNRVSVDGDTSVCDMVVMLANGNSENDTIISPDSDEFELFTKALEAGCIILSKEIAKDGEGATKLIELRINNVRSAKDAHDILNSVARSPLFKTAMFGEDANWGRILTAMGYSNVDFDPNKCSIKIGDLLVCEKGTAIQFDETIAKSILSEKEIIIFIDLNDGSYNDHMWTCDFSYDYVKINGSYRS